MDCIRTIVRAVFLSVIFQNLQAQDTIQKSVELRGYLKDIQSVSFVHTADSLITLNLIHNRINIKWNLVKFLYARIEIRNRIYYGEQVKLIPAFGKYVSADEGYLNLTSLWVNQKSLAAVSSVDRALLNYSFKNISFTAGRQRINWGVNTIWNPNDLFNAYNFLDFDYEERPGVDALRILYFFKSFSSLEFAFRPSNNKNQSIAAFLCKFNKMKYDFQVLGGLYGSDIALGVGWAGNIKEAGFKGEVTYFRNKYDLKENTDNLTASMTFDYSLKNSWYASVSALYVQNPAPVLFGTLSSSWANLSVKSLMPYRYSVYFGIMKSISPILTGNIALVYSPKANSTILFPTVTYNIAENFDLDLSGQSFFSDESGEYKSYGSTIHLRMRWSF